MNLPDQAPERFLDLVMPRDLLLDDPGQVPLPEALRNGFAAHALDLDVARCQDAGPVFGYLSEIFHRQCSNAGVQELDHGFVFSVPFAHDEISSGFAVWSHGPVDRVKETLFDQGVDGFVEVLEVNAHVVGDFVDGDGSFWVGSH